MPVDVGTLIANAEMRGLSMTASAGAMLTEATQTIDRLSDTRYLDALTKLPPTKMPSWVPLNLPAQPNLEKIELPDRPNTPSKPAIQSINPTIDAGTLPSPPSDAVPSIDRPIRPSEVRGFYLSAPDVNTDFSSRLPSPPSSFSGGAVPSIGEVRMPARPSISLPTFNGVMPDAPSSPPDTAGMLESAYRNASGMMMTALNDRINAWLTEYNPQFHAQLSRLEQRVQELASGETETGFKPNVEDAIYGRARSRISAEAMRAHNEAAGAMAGRGFTMPNGALFAAMNQARRSGNDQLAGTGREIVIKQAELNQQNVQFALNMSADLRKSVLQMSLSYHGNLIQINGQAINYAQAVVDAAVKLYDMVVKVYASKLDAYRAQAQVYETLVRATTVVIDIYKAEIEAEKAKVDVDVARIQAFREQVNAYQAEVDAYGKRVQAVVTAAELEKLKIAAFENQVRAYQAEVQAKQAEWQAYSAAWNGEESKVKAHLAAVQSYQAQIDAYKTRVQAEGVRVDAQAKTVEAQLRGYTAELQAYGEEVRADSQYVAAQATVQDAQLKAHQLQSQAAIEQAKTNAERFKAEVHAELEHKRLLMQGLLEQARLFVKSMESIASVHSSVGNSYAQMAGSALSGMNTLVTAEQQ